MTDTKQKTSACMILPNDKHRLVFILCLTIIYPMFCGCFFVPFMFIILPSVLFVGPVAGTPYIWLHMYWLAAAGLWLLLLLVFLPLMGPDKSDHRLNSVSYKRESGVSLRDDGGGEKIPLTNGHKIDDSQKLNGVRSSIASSVESLKKSCSEENLMVNGCSTDAIKASNTDLQTQSSDSLDDSFSKSRTLTQSGELLSGCLADMKSEEVEEPLQGEIIKGNTNCQVHASDLQSESGDRLDETNEDDRKSIEEPLLEKQDKSSVQQSTRHYADVDRVEELCSTPNDDQVNEAINVALNAADIKEGEVNLAEEEGQEVVEEMPVPKMRQKAQGLPKIDTHRVSQADCYAPSSFSPRESNVVFLYVNNNEQ